MSETIHQIDLPALDGANPLGFLAALGTLAVLFESDPSIKLGWHARARRMPYLGSPNLPRDIEEARKNILHRLSTHLGGEPVGPQKKELREQAQKRFDSAKTRLKEASAAFKKLGLPRGKEPDVAQKEKVEPFKKAFTEARTELLRVLKTSVPSAELALGQRPDCTIEEFRQHARTINNNARISDRTAPDMLAAFGAEIRSGDEEKIEPTPFCFLNGAGHQWFLDTAGKLMAAANEAKLRNALFVPWAYTDGGLSMRWDPLDDRRYALMDRDPTASDNKSTTVWMANLLAYRALAFFPCAGVGRGIGIAGWTENDATSSFTWPIWETALDANTIRSLLQHAAWSESNITASRIELRQRGVATAFRSSRLKIGKFINFSPSVVV